MVSFGKSEEKLVTVFISYAREDREIASKLYNDLKISGASPWMDTEDLMCGQNWDFIIKNIIRKSDYFIPMFSKISVDKKSYFHREIRLAIDELLKLSPEKKFLIPCRIDAVEIPYEELQSLHNLDLFPSYDEALRKLKLSIGLLAPKPSELKEYRELIRQVDQSLLKYKLAQAENILNQPFLFSNPAWISEINLKTAKTKRRLYDTLTHVQIKIPMYNYLISSLDNNEFLLQFKHDKEYGFFSKKFEQLLLAEGVEVLNVKTQKDSIPKGYSALVIPPHDAESVMLRSSNGRSILMNSEGAYDVNTGEKISDEELKNLSSNQREGIYVTKE